MFTRDSRRSRCPLGLHRILASGLAVAICSAIGSPVRAAEHVAATPYDRAALAEIAQDVLRGATSADESVPEETLPLAEAAPAATDVSAEPDPDSPATDIVPAREAITVPIPLASFASKNDQATPTADTTSYQSNSFRHRLDTRRALSFSSGVLAPSSGLDPELKSHADGLRAQGRQMTYGFVLLGVRADEALEKKLACLGVQLLGRHDDHYKARLPVKSLEALAALPEVEWVGVSPAELKVSSDLADLRDPGAKGAVDSTTPIPIVINLFEGDDDGSFRRELEAAGVAIGEYDASLQFYRAVATGPVIEKITALDFVLFVEPIGQSSGSHDQSTPLVDADLIRPGSVSFPPTIRRRLDHGGHHGQRVHAGLCRGGHAQRPEQVRLRHQLHNRRRRRLERRARSRHPRAGHDRRHGHRRHPLPRRGHRCGKHGKPDQGRQDLRPHQQRLRVLDGKRDGLDGGRFPLR